MTQRTWRIRDDLPYVSHVSPAVTESLSCLMLVSWCQQSLRVDQEVKTNLTWLQNPKDSLSPILCFSHRNQRSHWWNLSLRKTFCYVVDKEKILSCVGKRMKQKSVALNIVPGGLGVVLPVDVSWALSLDSGNWVLPGMFVGTNYYGDSHGKNLSAAEVWRVSIMIKSRLRLCFLADDVVLFVTRWNVRSEGRSARCQQ